MSEATAQALLSALETVGKIPEFDPTEDEGKVLTISNGEIAWVAPASET